jgi:hypothetical protein
MPRSWRRRRRPEPEAEPTNYFEQSNIVLHDLHAIYFFVPKVACSSLKKICAELLGIDVDLTDSVEPVHEVEYPFVRREELHEYSDYFKFAFVRNPWDRLVSCWSSKIAADPDRTDQEWLAGVHRCLADFPQFYAGMSFEAFAAAVVATPDDSAESHFRSQYLVVSAEDGTDLCDFVGRFENLNSDVAHVLQRLNVADRIRLSLLNPSRREAYADYYSPGLRDAVAWRYAEDIRRFDYSF